MPTFAVISPSDVMDSLIFLGVGITANVLDRVSALMDAKVDVIVLDSAHGHSENVLRCVRMIKENPTSWTL